MHEKKINERAVKSDNDQFKLLLVRVLDNLYIPIEEIIPTIIRTFC
tara:strand:- start:675 stop:812 length:138 start_codon:yes stop_codon:yes gene_type:complete